MAEQEAIPENVLEALEEVRAEGLTNMLARNTVIGLMVDEDAAHWLDYNEGRYMEALIAMGERRTKGN